MIQTQPQRIVRPPMPQQQFQQGPVMAGGPSMRPPPPPPAGAVPWPPPSQQITLQQRPVVGSPPGQQPPVVQGHPALVAAGRPQGPPTASTPTPPPPSQLNMTPPPCPPDNPQTDEDKAKAATYEKWLSEQDQAIEAQLNYYEKEISKLRKQRKVRTLKSFGKHYELIAIGDVQHPLQSVHSLIVRKYFVFESDFL